MLITSNRVYRGPQQGAITWNSLAHVPGGWVPIDIADRFSIVRWMQVGQQLPTEPFFERWIKVLRAQRLAPFEFETEVSLLSDRAEPDDAPPPKGVIFHVSRCGSTLVSNALAVARDALSLSEVPAIDKTMKFASAPSSYWCQKGIMGLRGIGRIFADYAGSPRRNVVIKTGYGMIPSFKAVRAAWPSVPCLMLTREPVEVIVSNFKSPSKFWTDWYSNPALCNLGIAPRSVLGAGMIEYYAWTIGEMCKLALQNLDNNCLVLDYRDLGQRTVLAIAQFFGLDISVSEAKFQDAFSTHAKSPEQPFADDSKTKREAATTKINETAERWAREPYERLLKSPLRLT